jgi:hypothetical protein
VSALLLAGVLVASLFVIGFVLRALWFLVKVGVVIVAVLFVAHLAGLG